MDFNQTHIQKFLTEIKKIKQIPSDEQMELFKQYQINPTPALRQKLINNNLRLAFKIILSKPTNNHNTIEDRMSVASIGIIKAVEDFKPEFGFKFSTFARKYIETELLTDFHHNAKTIKETSYVKEKIKNGDLDEIKTISGSTNISDEYNSNELQDTFESDTFDNQFDIDNNIDHQHKLDEFWVEIKAVLKPNQYDVIKAFYSDNVVVQGVKSKRMTDTAIADVLGTTKQNVGQIRMYALDRIRRSGILDKYKDNLDFFKF